MKRLLDLAIYWWKGLFTCRVYIACKMTHRNRREMISRAKYMCALAKQAGLEPISPVIEERVQARKGKLENHSKLRLHKKWKEDKAIICWKSHAVILDGAEAKSFGMEQEHGQNRYLWWKPTVLVMEYQGVTVADFEDDRIYHDPEAAFHYLAIHHGNLYRRWKWRALMINRSLPKFVAGQLWQWIH